MGKLKSVFLFLKGLIKTRTASLESQIWMNLLNTKLEYSIPADMFTTMFGCLINYFLTIVNGELSWLKLWSLHILQFCPLHMEWLRTYNQHSVVIMGCNWEWSKVYVNPIFIGSVSTSFKFWENRYTQNWRLILLYKSDAHLLQLQKDLTKYTTEEMTKHEYNILQYNE